MLPIDELLDSGLLQFPDLRAEISDLPGELAGIILLQKLLESFVLRPQQVSILLQ